MAIVVSYRRFRFDDARNSFLMSCKDIHLTFSGAALAQLFKYNSVFCCAWNFHILLNNGIIWSSRKPWAYLIGILENNIASFVDIVTWGGLRSTQSPITWSQPSHWLQVWHLSTAHLYPQERKPSVGSSDPSRTQNILSGCSYFTSTRVIGVKTV